MLNETISAKAFIEKYSNEYGIKDGIITKNIEKYCREYITGFKSKFCNKTELKCFNIGSLHNEWKYGYFEDSNAGEIADADRSEIGKVIQFCSFKNILENDDDLKNLDIELNLKIQAIWNWGKKRERITHTILLNGIPLTNGDTLNTFATLFSRPTECSLDTIRSGEYKADIIKKKLTREGETLPTPLMRNFYENYLRIGNFMLLPHSPNASLNTYRNGWKDSGCGWYDYFDLFLRAVRVWYQVKDKDENEIILAFENEFSKYTHSGYAYQDLYKRLSTEPNRKYFDSLVSFKTFVKFNSLEMFFENNDCGTLKPLRLNDDIFYHWINFEDENKTEDVVAYKDYEKFAQNYTNIAYAIIEQRAKEITDNCEKFSSGFSGK